MGDVCVAWCMVGAFQERDWQEQLFGGTKKPTTWWMESSPGQLWYKVGVCGWCGHKAAKISQGQAHHLKALKFRPANSRKPSRALNRKVTKSKTVF